MVKIALLGLHQYCTQTKNVFDGTVTLTSVVVEIVMLIFNTSDSWIRYIMLVRMLRVLRILMVRNKFLTSPGPRCVIVSEKLLECG